MSTRHQLPFGSPQLYFTSLGINVFTRREERWGGCLKTSRCPFTWALCSEHACHAQGGTAFHPTPAQNDSSTSSPCPVGCCLCSVWRKPENPVCLPLLWQFNLGLPLAPCKLFANMKRHSALLKAQLTWAQGKEALYRLHNGYSIALKKKKKNKWQPLAEKLKEEKTHFCKSIWSDHVFWSIVSQQWICLSWGLIQLSVTSLSLGKRDFLPSTVA